MPPKRPTTRGTRAASTLQQDIAGLQAVTLEDKQDATSDNVEESSRPAHANATRRLDTLQPSPLGTPGTRGRGTAARGLARPRGIGRRSHKDRAELEKGEQERRQAEAASKARETVWRQRRDLARSRGSIRGGRMRGGYAGDAERQNDTASSAVSGPFSMGEVTKSKGVRAAYSGSGSGSGGGGTARGTSGGAGHYSAAASGSGGGGASSSTVRDVKQEHGAFVTGTQIKREDGGYISSEDEAEGVRKLNIDDLVDLTIEDEGEDVAYLPPVRIQRIEHKERGLPSNAPPTTAINTGLSDLTSNVDKRRGKQRSKDFEITGESHRYKGAYTDSSSEDEGQIKAEPMDDDTSSAVAGALQDPPTSPETRRKLKERIKADVSAQDVQKPAFQTKEEEIEWDIHQRDLRVLRTELGQSALPPSAMSEADVTENETTEDPRADKVYLFQLPAILPGLVPVVSKAEDEDVTMREVPEVDTARQNTNSKAKRSILQNGSASLPSGLVGKLRVHASGKAYLDWGGVPMEVCMGQEATFLQDVLVLDPRDVKPAAVVAEEVIAGTALSMGQVKGKFVVVPEWDKIFEEAA